MHAVPIVIVRKGLKLSFHITCVPEQYLIQILASNGPNESFHKWMRYRDIGDRFDFLDAQTAQLPLPALGAEHWMVVGAEVCGNAPGSSSLGEHVTQRRPIDFPTVHSEADDTSRELVHDDQHPVGLQGEGFTAKQIDAP